MATGKTDHQDADFLAAGSNDRKALSEFNGVMEASK
jgi:hypothetical protein